MDPIQAMMGTAELDEEKLRMIAQQLRGDTSTGARLSTSSLAPIQNQGRLMQTKANSEARDIGLQQARGKAQRSKDDADAAKAANLDKATRFSKFSNSFTERLSKEARSAEETMALIGRFGGNEFAGEIPLLGKAENWAVGKAPELFGENAKRSMQWWKDWNNYYNNPTRNELFGSALTAPEQRAWDQANINPDMNDEEINRSLTTLGDILKKRSMASLQRIRSQGMPEEFSTSVYQDILSPEEFADPSAGRSAIQERLSGEDYGKGVREGTGGGEVDYSKMSLEELRRLKAEQDGL